MIMTPRLLRSHCGQKNEELWVWLDEMLLIYNHTVIRNLMKNANTFPVKDPHCKTKK